MLFFLKKHLKPKGIMYITKIIFILFRKGGKGGKDKELNILHMKYIGFSMKKPKTKHNIEFSNIFLDPISFEMENRICIICGIKRVIRIPIKILHKLNKN